MFKLSIECLNVILKFHNNVVPTMLLYIPKPYFLQSAGFQTAGANSNRKLFYGTNLGMLKARFEKHSYIIFTEA